MAAKATIRMDIETYRRTPFENPEPHFVDGELEPRTLGEYAHSLITARLIIAFFNNPDVHAIPEIRIRITPSRVRTADVAVIGRKVSIGSHGELTSAEAIFEIMSPGQSANSFEMQRLFQDYASLDIDKAYLLDPNTKQVYYWNADNGRLALYALDSVLIAEQTLTFAPLWEGL